jgi:hypothetical protein
MTDPSRFIRSRPLQVLAAALAILAVSFIAAAPRAAAATSNCNYDGRTFLACLSLDYQGYLWYDAHVDLDVALPPQYASEIVACGADLTASLWGDDGGGSDDDFIRNFVVTPGWPVATSTGFSAQLYTKSLYYTKLDEDDGTDEIYARVSYWDCHTGLTRSFRTGTIWGNF